MCVINMMILEQHGSMTLLTFYAKIDTLSLEDKLINVQKIAFGNKEHTTDKKMELLLGSKQIY